jgi:hypothetical protein
LPKKFGFVRKIHCSFVVFTCPACLLAKTKFLTCAKKLL